VETIAGSPFDLSFDPGPSLSRSTSIRSLTKAPEMFLMRQRISDGRAFLRRQADSASAVFRITGTGFMGPTSDRRFNPNFGTKLLCAGQGV
jgi:hypothetical protein